MNKRLTGFLLWSMLVLPGLHATARQTGEWSDGFIQGYSRSVKGGGFAYHAPQPDVNTSLLVRADDAGNYIEWQTAQVPAVLRDSMVSFIWMYGIDANPDSYPWELRFNGEPLATFSNPVITEKVIKIVRGNDGASLIFRPTLVDKYNDLMGYAILQVPASLVRPGEPQTIRVTGAGAGKQTWYMTFESPVEEQVSVVQEEMVVKQEQKLFRVLEIRLVHLGDSLPVTISLNPGEEGEQHILQPGYNAFRMLVPDTTVKTVGNAWIRIGDRELFSILFKTDPVRRWTIYLVQHSHTDIGYTRPQTEILPEHLRYIDYALDFCDQTDHYPPDARFRWTCETTWPVREYLMTRPPRQIERLRKRVAEGRIEIAGLFLNSSDLADEASIATSLQPIRMIREAGMPVRTAMQNDINGIPWCLVDYLSEAGIEFLNIAENTHRALKPFDIPTTFWWESPSGKRLLANRPEHYMTGNMMGILTSRETFAKNLSEHLRDLRIRGYAFSHYPVQFSGYLTDNSPPSTTACNLVATWNESYEWPKLKLATISEFLEVMMREHAEELPVYRAAWPDWWIDGFGSAPIETAYARQAHADNIANKSLMALSTILGSPPPGSITGLQQQVDDALAFYDEHTFGAAESIRDPLAENSIVQKGEKLSYVWEAVKKNRLIREMTMGLIQDTFPRSGVPVITVVNTLNWTRSGVVTLYIDHEILPRDHAFEILAEDGKPVAIQPLHSREDGTYWALLASDVPPLGYRTFRIVSHNQPVETTQTLPFTGILENRFYSLEIDPQTGRITRFFDKELHVNLIDPEASYTLGTLIHESLGANRAQLEQYRLEEFTRTTWSEVTPGTITEGPVWKTLTLTGQLPGSAQGLITCEVRLNQVMKQLDLTFSLKKVAVTDPEALYVAFPFLLSDSRFSVEIAGAAITPGIDQLEGSSSDWIGFQNFIALRNNRMQILYSTPEIPLVQLGGINLGEFSRKADPKTSHLYSWVMNNYWTTNFLASQEGELRWSYALTSSADTSGILATRFGWGTRIPLLSRIFPAGQPDSVIIPRSFLGSSTRDVLLVAAYPSADGSGIILHLREVNGRPVRFPVRDMLVSVVDLLSATRATRALEVNVLEEEISTVADVKNIPLPGSWFEMAPYETRFLKLVFD